MSQPVNVHAQAAGDVLFKEGNRLFRAGLYYAALGRYRDAQTAGKQSSLLHYNMGVAHYKLGHYQDAKAALSEAAREPRLAGMAYYNLGLTARAMRDLDDAEHWFQLARDRAGNQKIEKLATRALQDLRQPVAQNIPIYDQDRRRADLEAFFQRQDPIGEFEFVALARIGEDDNVYRTPSESYIDFSRPDLPVVNPVVQSGTFLPVDIDASYRLYGNEWNDFIFSYTLAGDFYLDSALSNANRVNQELSFGADVTLDAKEGRSRSFLPEFIFGYHDRRNFDPDNGFDREVDGIDVSERFKYFSWGPAAEYRHRLNDKLGYGVRFEAQMRSYEDPILIPSFSHDVFLLGGYVSYRVRPRIHLRFGYDAYLRDYAERIARDLNGNRLSTNPTLEYRYQAVQATLGFRLNRRLWLRADFRRTEREDQFVGYNDYSQNAYRVQLDLRPMRRFRINLAVTQRTFDYPNAFAFNEPIAGPRELDATTGSLWAEYRITRRLSAWAEIKLTDVTSTDTRTQYDRTRTMIGVKWQMRK